MYRVEDAQREFGEIVTRLLVVFHVFVMNCHHVINLFIYQESSCLLIRPVKLYQSVGVTRTSATTWSMCGA